MGDDTGVHPLWFRNGENWIGVIRSGGKNKAVNVSGAWWPVGHCGKSPAEIMRDTSPALYADAKDFTREDARALLECGGWALET